MIFFNSNFSTGISSSLDDGKGQIFPLEFQDFSSVVMNSLTTTYRFSVFPYLKETGKLALEERFPLPGWV